MKDIKELHQAIRNLHESDAQQVESVPVKETHKGQTVWEGIAEVFDFVDHPKAKRAYPTAKSVRSCVYSWLTG